MGKFLIRLLINALAIWAATWVLPGVNIAAAAIVSSSTGESVHVSNQTLNTLLAYLFIGLIFGLVNSLVKPIAKILSFPITILTLGLFTIVINAAMLWLTAWISTATPVHFTISTFFWQAVLAALITSVVAMVASSITGVNRRRQVRR